MDRSVTKPVSTNSVSRAFDIMKCLGSESLGNDEIAKRTKLNKSTTNRLLKILKSAGFANQDYITRKYFLGPEIIKLAKQYLFNHENLNIAAYPDMVHLRNITGETVILVILVGMEKMSIFQVGSQHPIRYTENPDFHSPLYTGADGKILLSQFRNKDIELYIKSFCLDTNNKKTIRNVDSLIKDIKKAKKEGYSTSSGEVVSSVAAIAVPIRNYIVPACLFISGPRNRWRPKMLNFVQEMLWARDRIENKIG